MVEAIASAWAAVEYWVGEAGPSRDKPWRWWVRQAAETCVSVDAWAIGTCCVGTLLYLLASSLDAHQFPATAFYDTDAMVAAWAPRGFTPPSYSYLDVLNTRTLQVAADYLYLTSAVLYTVMAWRDFDPSEWPENAPGGLSSSGTSSSLLDGGEGGVQLVASKGDTREPLLPPSPDSSPSASPVPAPYRYSVRQSFLRDATVLFVCCRVGGTWCVRRCCPRLAPAPDMYIPHVRKYPPPADL